MHTGARIPGIQGGGGACKYSGCSVGGKRYCATNFNNIMVQDVLLVVRDTVLLTLIILWYRISGSRACQLSKFFYCWGILEGNLASVCS